MRQQAVLKGEKNVHVLRKIAREKLQVDELDYLEFVNPNSLQPLKTIENEARVLIAAWISNTRLIDNMSLNLSGEEHE